jgi:hypothetical protein
VESLTWKEPTSEAWVVSALVMLGADGASQDATSIEVDGADPQLRDDVGCLLWDLVWRGVSIDVPGSATPGDAALAPGFLGVMGPGVSRQHLQCSPAFRPHLSTGGRWGMKQSPHVHRLLPRRSCCMRC